MAAILKSKAFWGVSTLTATVSSAVAYDRYKAHELYTRYLQEASLHGAQPLLSHQAPRRLAIFLISPTSIHHQSLQAAFKSFAVELLTRAGVDYQWIVEVDGEEAKARWDQLARDANKPELMLETMTIPIDVLSSRILSNEPLDSDTKFLWEGLRSKFAPQSTLEWPQGSDGFLTLDPHTFESLKSHLETKKSENETKITAPIKPKKSSWFSSSKHQQSIQSPSIFPVNLYSLPCCLPQSPSARLRRFLFGQQETTRLIGEAVLKVIKEQPDCTI